MQINGTEQANFTDELKLTKNDLLLLLESYIQLNHS